MPLSSTPPVGLATLSANARTVLAKRYLVKDRTGKPTETPEELFWRVATVVAEADARYGANEEQVQKVALDLARNLSPAEIAERHDVALSTIRTHLLSLFAKTGTNRQSPLVALLLRTLSLPHPSGLRHGGRP